MISETVLVLGGPFAQGLDGERVCAAISRGMTAAGGLECDLAALTEDIGSPVAERSKWLEEIAFDRRMLAARAVVIACARLEDRALAGSIAFEAATRARQSGVPAYAVTGHDGLDPFEARILDLQVILEASGTRALSTAGRKLATLV